MPLGTHPETASRLVHTYMYSNKIHVQLSGEAEPEETLGGNFSRRLFTKCSKAATPNHAAHRARWCGVCACLPTLVVWCEGKYQVKLPRNSSVAGSSRAALALGQDVISLNGHTAMVMLLARRLVERPCGNAECRRWPGARAREIIHIRRTIRH